MFQYFTGIIILVFSLQQFCSGEPCIQRRMSNLLMRFADTRNLLPIPVCTGFLKTKYAGPECSRTGCYCLDINGNNITGYDVTPLKKKESLKNCDCARAKLAEKDAKQLLGRQKIQCTKTGLFAAKQCHGSVCSCYTEEGIKLKSYSQKISDSNSMDCKCARHKARLERETFKSMFSFDIPQCDSKGDYTLRQCRGLKCWCVDSHKTGQNTNLYGALIGQKNAMNCKCAVAQAKFQKSGLLGLTFRCNQLGNYKPVQCRGSSCHCVNTDGQKISSIESKPIHKIFMLNCP